MSVTSKSYEDAVEIVKETENTEVYISPRYKGKNPKSPEELAKIREERKAKRLANKKPHGLYESKDKMVSHPSHYQCGKYEALDIIAEATRDLTGIFATDTGNALKYLLRWNKKGSPRQDLEKSMFYISHLLKALDESEAQMKG